MVMAENPIPINIIEIMGLYHTYPDNTLALQNINLSIAAGSRTAVLGPNGAGKSTLLLYFNATYLPQRGQVMIDGQVLNRDNELWAKIQVGLVFQDPDDQIFASSVWEDVAFGPRNLKLSTAEINRRVENSLKIVDMWKYRQKAPHRLSYGEKKRVAIAGVLAMDPQIIVVDEPMAYLDPAGQREVFAILNYLNQKGTTLVIATHDVDTAAAWADQVIILQEGMIYASGGPELLLEEKMMHQVNLRLPLVSQVFLGVKKQKRPELLKIPLSVEEGISTLEHLIRTGGE